MKKIILALILFLFFIPFVSDAKNAGSSCKKDDQSAEGCPYNKDKYPNGLKCNLMATRSSGKCVDLTQFGTDLQQYGGGWCLEDSQCKKYPGYTIICNKATWRCEQSDFNGNGAECLRDNECREGYFCNKTSEKGTGKCEIRGTAKYGTKCSSHGECASELECFVLPGNKDGECRYIKSSRQENQYCTVSTECAQGLYCTTVGDSTTGVCKFKLASTAGCQTNDQCSDGYCADADGVALSEGGKAPGTCRNGAKEGEACSIITGSSKKCASGLICTGANEQTKEGKCAKDIISSTESLDQKAEREKVSSSLDYQMNLYCNAETTPGLFTKGVSNECFNCGNCGSRDIMIVIANVINGVLQLTGLFAVLSCIVSGFMYIISRGNEEKTGKAKAALTASIVGLIIIFTGWILINTIMTVLGYNCGSWFAPNFTC